jgi:nucleotidyltransferase/DNA polymerase involved in DNA repair
MSKIFATIDMDAYYASVESRRLNLEDSVPLAVR